VVVDAACALVLALWTGGKKGSPLRCDFCYGMSHSACVSHGLQWL
jgi:hypothetical protein